jgi:hypothetical protein
VQDTNSSHKSVCPFGQFDIHSIGMYFVNLWPGSIKCTSMVYVVLEWLWDLASDLFYSFGSERDLCVQSIM